MEKVIIFDLDGTVLDTIEDITSAMNFALSKHGFGKISLEGMKNCVGGSAKDMAKSALKILKINEDDVIFEKVANSYIDAIIKTKESKTKVFDGVENVIFELKKKGYKVCICSNKSQQEVDVLMTGILEPLEVDCALGVSDFIKAKPSADCVEFVMKKFNAKANDCWFIGDGETDVLTAKNANVNCIAVLWGNRNKETLEEFGAKNFANTPLDILNIIF